MKKSVVLRLICTVIITLMMTSILVGCVGSTSDEKSDIGKIKEGTITDTTNANYQEYKNTVKGFSIYAIKEWHAEENIKQAAFAFFNTEKDKDDFAESVNLLIQDMKDTPVTMQQYTEGSEKDIKKLTNANIESSEDVTFGGLNGHKIVYSSTAKSINFKKMSVYTMKDGKVYLLTYTAKSDSYSKFINKIEEVVKSFKFL